MYGICTSQKIVTACDFLVAFDLINCLKVFQLSTASKTKQNDVTVQCML